MSKYNNFYTKINDNNIFLKQKVIRKSDNVKGIVKNVNILSNYNCLILFEDNSKKIYSKKNINELEFFINVL